MSFINFRMLADQNYQEPLISFRFPSSEAANDDANDQVVDEEEGVHNDAPNEGLGEDNAPLSMNKAVYCGLTFLDIPAVFSLYLLVSQFPECCGHRARPPFQFLVRHDHGQRVSNRVKMLRSKLFF